MLLRAGGEGQGTRLDARAARDTAIESGVSHGALLLAFADALMGTEEVVLAERRAEVAGALGAAALVDAAAIVAAFQFVDRVADASGIPLDAIVDFASQDVQRELGLRAFGSASNTPARALQRVAGRLLAPFRSQLMRFGARLLR